MIFMEKQLIISMNIINTDQLSKPGHTQWISAAINQLFLIACQELYFYLIWDITIVTAYLRGAPN